jgi:hypothetical protein
MRMRAALTAVTVTALLGATGAGIVQADTKSSEGFEFFATGDVNNQFGWQKTGSSYDVAIVNPNTGFGVTDMGTRALRMSNAYVDGGFGGQTFSASLADEAGEASAVSDGESGGTRQRVFTATFSLRTTEATEQEGLYASISPDRGDGARMSYLRLEDQTDGVHVFFDDYATGTGFSDVDVATLSRDEKHTLGLSMVFVDGPANDVVWVSIDGSVVHTGTSWEDYFRDVELTATRTVDSLLFREGSNNPANDARPALAGQGFLVDDVVLTSGPTAACAFATTSTTMTLVADCTTDHTITVPPGVTLDGADHTITAVDPPGGGDAHFVGAVVQNGGSIASVENLGVTANVATRCDEFPASLAGIRFDGASGSITGNTVNGLQQSTSGDGCQEGNAIEVRNTLGGARPSVTVSGNTAVDYQKTGVLAKGVVSATITGNTVGGYGPVSFIAQNGVQVSLGATAQVSGNSISDNYYTGADLACGLLLYEAGGVKTSKNTFSGNEKDLCNFGRGGGKTKPV